MNIASLLRRAALVTPSNTAILIGTTPVVDFASLANRSASLARHLLEKRGLAHGDRVILFMRNCTEYIECLFGCWYAGLVCVPVNAKLHAREVAYILTHAGAKASFCTLDLTIIMAEALALASIETCETIEVNSATYRAATSGDPMAMRVTAGSDPAWLFYTSGTTGRPKGATLTHANLLAMTVGYFADVDAPSAQDCLLHAAPMSHGSGLYILTHMAAMGRQVLPESGQFEPNELLGLFDRLRGVTMFAAPTMVNRLVKSAVSGRAFPGLRSLIYGGGPMYLEDCKAALEVFGNRLVQIYGQGESPMTISVLPKRLHADDTEREDRLGSVGYPQAIVEVATIGEDGQPLPPGEVGEIVVRGGTVMRGYWNDTEATARTIVDGWLKTGDMGTFNNTGLLTLKDRSKDVIISGGSNIYPREVEDALLRHPGVSEVAVIGSRSEIWGEMVVAFVVSRASGRPTEAELDRLCEMHIARFKKPKAYLFVDCLPKNNYGKVVKTELRTLAAALDGRIAGDSASFQTMSKKGRSR